MARYTYDAWGKVTGVKDKSGNAITGASHVANINPFRYRGYYFDGEIGLYYLQSRYYDPVVGRFVNSDESDIICDLSGFREALNYYVYCSCNPVSNIDENGKWKSPKIVAFGIQVEANVSFLSGGGFEFIFANGKVYVFGYIGAAAGQALNDILQWIKLSLLKAFSKKNPLASIEQFLSGSISVCLFAVFSSTVSYFAPEGYVGPFIGHCFAIPTIYGIAAKTFFTTYNTYTCIGVGVSYPPAWDNSLVYTHYMLLGTINLSATIRNFVDKKTKGLKA